jgi:hypothetical protein
VTFEQRVYQTAINGGLPIPLSLLVVAQSKHESNNYTSAIFLDCNNTFGYKAVRSSCQLHADYQNYQDIEASTTEIVNWIYRRLNEGNFPPLESITTPEQYAQLLKNNGYYGDSVTNYTAGLIRWFKSNIEGVVIAGGSLLVIAFLAYLYFRKKKYK